MVDQPCVLMERTVGTFLIVSFHCCLCASFILSTHSMQGIRSATVTVNSPDFCQFVDRSSIRRDSALDIHFDTT